MPDTIITTIIITMITGMDTAMTMCTTSIAVTPMAPSLPSSRARDG